MSIQHIEIQIIASLVAVTCALPGVFLVLRRLSLMSDAISHAILLGIVLAFFVVENLASPLLIVGAGLVGLAVVVGVELLTRTRLVHEDSAIGLVFPALFSLGVILISRYAGNVHLDTDAVLLGELAFAPFDRISIFGHDIGPRAVYVVGVILVINLAFITIFYKELKLATFDKALAATLGFAPLAIHYVFMSLVSVTAVGAFDTVGSVLVVALMIAPPAAAYLLTDTLWIMLLLSAVFGLISALSGFWLSVAFDASIAGFMATMSGVMFLVVLLVAPKRGLVSKLLTRRKQKREIATTMLLVHLLHHENAKNANIECNVSNLPEHLHWHRSMINRIIQFAQKSGFLSRSGELLALTDSGRKRAQEDMIY
ncbi:MAG: metal ABC transporter permease [Candidatus Auribacterota bacterium]|jgi:manganese/zinc/iron transport system permease protein|uniref:Metal ABC transporter permease n=1 Tax=Candidatus Auribacter fodinae TaxID=2093366 RepID=A0A3A4R383_9BACT|nr:MAG: metal ABC transporter permease [Candidatus Auribacter fodinae]